MHDIHVQIKAISQSFKHDPAFIEPKNSDFLATNHDYSEHSLFVQVFELNHGFFV